MTSHVLSAVFKCSTWFELIFLSSTNIAQCINFKVQGDISENVCDIENSDGHQLNSIRHICPRYDL